MKKYKIRATKKQFNELMDWNLGAGILILHSGEKETLTIEVYTDISGTLRRCFTGEALFPLHVKVGDDPIIIKKGNE